ncbi:ATP-dependent DNA ligase [Amycolatopsis arida]|uniref:ATP-dependent DNA ligase n=1 Tax=Amycolatopsis arida TaxID=587909 RepID=UPI001066B980|nr:ATP-dependent DNA ligase [Amycolatopsis arida]TDX84926.1 ATP dependent DNA ligase-like protein [Amycolatopsis arida]
MAAVVPPVALALAQPAARLPGPGSAVAYEPKFDGWRAALFAEVGVVQSRRGTDLAGRFPELREVASGLGDVVLDGEIVALAPQRGLDFGALAWSPARRAAAGVAVYYVVFDLLAEAETDWRSEPYGARRRQLERLLAGVAPPVQLVPSSTDYAQAVVWMRPEQARVGIEGVVAKAVGQPYRAGRSTAWLKIRQLTVVEAAVVGVTGSAARPDELVLARPDESGALRPIGLSLPLPPRLAAQVAGRLTATGEPPRQVSSGVFGRGRSEYLPVHPDLVVEAEVEPTVATFTARLRPRVHRLRPDLTRADLTR